MLIYVKKSHVKNTWKHDKRFFFFGFCGVSGSVCVCVCVGSSSSLRPSFASCARVV